jgi:prolyl-tRNA synthetase
VEQSHDENGIIWPMSVAPFHVIICPIMNAGEEAVGLAEKIYEELLAAGIEAVIDDRDERPGVKFKDADIIGIPIRITVGKKAAEGIVEYKRRHEKESIELADTAAVKRACAEVFAELERG